jgi:hypothetical protein
MVAEPLESVVSSCRCGRAHDLDSWCHLPLLAYSGRQWGGARTTYQKRRCDCGGVLSLYLTTTTANLTTTTTEGAVHV